MLVTTPPDGTTTPLVLTIQRIGGTVGVISVDWSLASVNGEIPSHIFPLPSYIFPCISQGSGGSSSIQPVSGHLVFISGDVVETITVWLQPNNVPSVTEVILTVM